MTAQTQNIDNILDAFHFARVDGLMKPAFSHTHISTKNFKPISKWQINQHIKTLKKKKKPSPLATVNPTSPVIEHESDIGDPSNPLSYDSQKLDLIAKPKHQNPHQKEKKKKNQKWSHAMDLHC